ncbi:MAG: hypothetical protein OZ917_06550 [Candidatus Brocadiaceae bacterium]|nr:hypothetical protein [Candidatus Brocadiaceae bacterium]
MIEDEKETCTELIEVFEQQQEFGIIPISAVQSPIKSRDELPPILRVLQHIYVSHRS